MEYDAARKLVKAQVVNGPRIVHRRRDVVLNHYSLLQRGIVQLREESFAEDQYTRKLGAPCSSYADVHAVLTERQLRFRSSDPVELQRSRLVMGIPNRVAFSRHT